MNWYLVFTQTGLTFLKALTIIGFYYLSHGVTSSWLKSINGATTRWEWIKMYGYSLGLAAFVGYFFGGGFSHIEKAQLLPHKETATIVFFILSIPMGAGILWAQIKHVDKLRARN